jgi:hypothetical protein
MDAPTDVCPETTEQKSSPTKKRPRTEPKKRLRQHPQHTTRHLARCVLLRSAIFFNIQHFDKTGQKADDISYRNELWNAQTRCVVERSETFLVNFRADGD